MRCLLALVIPSTIGPIRDWYGRSRQPDRPLRKRREPIPRPASWNCRGCWGAVVKWLWTVNVVPGPQVSAIKAWWPGAAYVTWIGIDGHYFQAPVRFAGLF